MWGAGSSNEMFENCFPRVLSSASVCKWLSLKRFETDFMFLYESALIMGLIFWMSCDMFFLTF